MNHSIRTLLLILVLSACSRPTRLEQALDFAGANKSELEAVLAHYSKQPSDSLKYQAARFLIENMTYHYTEHGEEVDRYFNYVDSLFALPNISYAALNAALKEAPGWNQHIEKKHDVQFITSDFLINHIEQAFATRFYPWCANLPFETFCEYILPYRFAQEPLDSWMSTYRSYVGSTVDSLITQGATPAAICAHLISYMKHPATDIDLGYQMRFDYNPSKLLTAQTRWSVGACKELTALGTYTMHSVGLPVAWDFTPQWANRSGRHDWNSIRMDSVTIPFVVKDNSSFGQHMNDKAHDKFAKVYRNTFRIQEQSLVMQDLSEEIPPFFLNPYFKDVTEQYGACVDLKANLITPPPRKKKIAYIMTFDNQSWIPVHWSRIHNKQVRFSKMCTNIAYMIMYYDRKEFHPATPPFIINDQGKVHALIPQTDHPRSVVLRRKYPNVNVSDIPSRIKGGVFQAANQMDFRDAVLLHRIDSISDVVPHTVELQGTETYRYFRYLSATNGYVNMAEIELFDPLGRPIPGTIIGTEDKVGLRKDRTMVFDQDPLTYFQSREAFGAWVGLSFQQPTSIKRIVFLPRNDDNYIKQGENYELFYYDKDWISLGQQKGETSGGVLTYHQVPENALLLLRNRTKGVEERIFTYENEQQVWW